MKTVFKIVSLSALSLVLSVHAASFELDKAGNEPFYQTMLPLEVYQASRSNELQDLTITNAAGEQVPYALLADEALHPQNLTNEISQQLVVHAITESQLENASALHVQLNQTGQNTAVDIQTNSGNKADKKLYLIDAGVKHPAFRTLRIDWQGSEGKLLALDVLVSDNLKDWHMLGSAVLIKSASDHASLVQNVIDIDGDDTSRYLQLRPTGEELIAINQVQAQYLTKRSADRTLLLQKLTLALRASNQQEHVINLDFEANGRYPAQYLRVDLPEINTVTSARFYVRNKANEPWQYLTTASLYRTEKSGKLSVNPDIELNQMTARYWRMQFDEAHGGLGATSPSLSVGWRPQTVVWNARGSAPFVLGVGNSPSVINSVSVQSLIPDYAIEKVLQLPKANVGVATLNATNVSTNQTAATSNTWSASPDYKSWLLWAGLGLGVLLLAGMAYSLLKNDNKN